jgi:hypothetical protein
VNEVNYIGIDLGKRGALVALRQDGSPLWWCRAPLLGKEYDGFRMHEAGCRLARLGESRAFIEAPNVMKLYPAQAMAVGVGFGRWMQVLEAVGIGYVVVPARTWVRTFLPAPKRKPRDPQAPSESPAEADARRKAQRASNKEALLARARQLHPTVIPWEQLSWETASGVADALLIAEHGRLRG